MKFPLATTILVSLTALFLVTGGAWADDSTIANPNFAQDVRPILSAHCFACHGPDAAERKADLRLDTADGIASVFDSSSPADSEIFTRITSSDPDQLMPPAEFHKPLSANQKNILLAWVKSGGKFQQHWAFTAPQKKPNHASTSIDSFLDTQIAQAGLKATPTADRRTLLRRVCLDLTGLPPTREQLQTFLSDKSPKAYEKLVDRLIATPAYGEHMARHWLDLVRYGDTHGLHLDNYREMWPYRDWVIDAFTNNMPMDQFITEQLAGDLLPDATDSQKIASGFNRLNVTTNEGGSIYDEVFARNVIDRTDSFGTIFLSLTTGCAVCHDHKFDPISQKDYYSLTAYFNSLDGRAMDENIKDPAPVLKVFSKDAREQLADFETALTDIEAEMAGPIKTVDAAQAVWESSLVSGTKPKTVVLKPETATSSAGKKMTIDDAQVVLSEPAAAKDTTTIVATLPQGGAWQTLRLEALLGDSKLVGASKNGNVVLTEIQIATALPDAPDDWIPVPIKHAIADIEQSDGPFGIDYAIDGKENDSQGWGAAGHQQPGPRNAWLIVPALMSDAQISGAKIRVQLKYQSKFAAHQFKRVRLSLSDAGPMVPQDQRIKLSAIHSIGPFPVESPAPGYARSFASRGRAFKADETFNYEDQPHQWKKRDDMVAVSVSQLPSIADRASVVLLHQNIQAPRAQKATLLLGSDDGHVIYLNGKRLAEVKGPAEFRPLHHEYVIELKKGDNRLYIKTVNHSDDAKLSFAWRSPAIDVPSQLLDLLRSPVAKRSDENNAALQKYYRSVYCLHPDWLALVDQRKGIQTARDKISSDAPTTLIWKELAKPRAAKILNRGQYDQPGEAVARATPGFLPPMSQDLPNDRLGLARWLCSDENPLTARVAVNRFWQQIFGTGLVKTSEDFGSQGEPPSHPLLLDHLAIDFRQNGWNVNELIKSMVTSEAYQRSSQSSQQAQEIDPENRFLARGPRHRLDAEVLRDQALALAGLLRSDVVGGPSVKPPQPAGLWLAVGYSGSNTVKFTADTADEKVHRRSVYIFWKRTSAPPTMTTFDAPSRESCTARRERTNTPMQALLLMNETQYLQAAKHLGQRVLQQSELANDQQRLAWLFETVTMRPPSEFESRELSQLLADLKEHFAADTEATKQFVGQASVEKAAWTMIASTMLNLDEVVSN